MTTSVLKEIKHLNCRIKKIIDKRMPKNVHVNVTQMQIVTYLFKHENEEICQKDLEAETHLKKASITGALDSLEDEGLIERIQSSEDKRRNIIKVTEKAEKERQNIVCSYNKVNKAILKNLTDQQIQQFLSILSVMNKNLDEGDF